KVQLSTHFEDVQKHQAQKAIMPVHVEMSSQVLEDYQRTLTEVRDIHAYWQAVKTQQIPKLLWWTPELIQQLNFPPEAKVWHIHPLALMENFKLKNNWFDIEKFITIYKNKHSAIFGFYEKGRKVIIPQLTQESEKA